MNSARKTFDIIPDADMLGYAYWYDYDHRGLVTLRKLPGRDAISYIYDPAGRLVAEQDGISAPTLWTLHLYDRYGREVVTGNARWTEEQALSFAAKVRPFVHTGASRAGGYSQAGYSPAMNEVFVSRRYNAKGQLFKEEGGNVTSTYTYDTFGRMHTKKVETLWGTVKETFTYTYTGKPMKTVTEMELTEGGAIPRVTTAYSYDAADRLVRTEVSGMGDSTAVTTLSYDAVGRLHQACLGASVRRTLAYDVRGWLDSTETVISRQPLSHNPALPPIAALSDASFPFRASAVGAVPEIGEEQLMTTRLVERLLYANGRHPRYNGNISSRVFPGGRYDYTYDDNNRLTAADFVPTGREPRADYSTSYAYDANANITSLTRHGVVNVVGGWKTYGVIDQALFSYSGNQVKTYSNAPDDGTFEGRTGLGEAGSWTMGYDANGNLVSDSRRGITSVAYNHLDLPTRVDLADGGSVAYLYGHDGMKRRAVLRSASGHTVAKRLYAGPATIENDTLKMYRFAGGYFDQKLEPHYYVTDYQGNITHDVAADGTISQQTTYYPYGEPWQEPKGDNTYLFGGKERETFANLHMLDFGPRSLSSSLAQWSSPDILSESFHHISPYSFCGGNPVNRTDRTGMHYDEIIGDTTIIIRARYLAVEEDAAEARRAAAFWNDQSNKFALQIKVDGKTVNLAIVFDLSVEVVEKIPEVKNHKTVRAVLNARIGETNLNTFSVTEISKSNLNGSTQVGRITYIQPYRRGRDTSFHEFGHTLGALHSATGIMTESSEDPLRSNSVQISTIKEIIFPPIEGKVNRDPNGEAGKGTMINSILDNDILKNGKIIKLKK